MTYMLIMVSASSRKEAEKIVNALLERKLIACANVLGPVSSSFWWQGKIDRAEEYIVFMKTEEKFFEEATKLIKQLHSYEVPEIIALPIVKGFKLYLEWVSESLRAGE